MGFSEKAQVEGGTTFESDNNNNNRKWVIAGIALRAPLKPIYVSVVETEVETEEECSTTPTGEESRIPTTFTCPPAPKKPKSTSSSFKCNKNFRGGVVRREFFTPPDLETVFIRHVERAN